MANTVTHASAVTSAARAPGGCAPSRLAGTPWAKSRTAVVLYAGFVRFGHGLARAGVSANTVTYVSLLLATASGVLAALGAFVPASAMVLASGVCDALDGIVARARNEVTPYGALLDSFVDRLSDAAPLLGLAVLGTGAGLNVPQLTLAAAAALVASFAVSYARARALSLGADLPQLFMRRPERVMLVAASLAAGPLSPWACIAGTALLAVLACLGAVFAMRTARSSLRAAPERAGALGANHS